MNREKMYEKIKEAIVASLKETADMDKITEDTDLVEELGITSIINIEIFVRLESEFGIEVADEDLSLEIIKNLPTLADYIEKQLQYQS